MLLNQFVVKTFRSAKCTSTRKSGGDEDAHDDCELQSAPSCEANKRKNTNRKFGKILLKIRKNTFKNQDPGRKITFSDYAKGSVCLTVG